jgi:hypothetical protein
MNKILTAEEFFNKRAKECGFENWIEIIVHQEWKYLELFPIEFAKLHVEAALKAAEEKTKTECNNSKGFRDFVNSNSIIEAYPLDNIK